MGVGKASIPAQFRLFNVLHLLFQDPPQVSLKSEGLTSDTRSLDFRVGLDALPDSRHQATPLRAIHIDMGLMQSQAHQLQNFCVLLHTKCLLRTPYITHLCGSSTSKP